MGEWGKGNTVGRLYTLTEEDLSNIGHCWMRGRLKVDDLVLCLRHSGDAFYTYILITKYANGMRGIPQSEFGSYVLCNPAHEKFNITNREHYLLAAGELVKREEWLERKEKIEIV